MATRKKSPGSDIADRLLDAHTRFVIGQIDGAALETWLSQELATLLVDAERLKVKDMVKPAAIKATAHTYAVEVRFGAGLPELVGEIARSLHAHPIHDKTRFGDLLSDRRFAESVDKVLELRSLREKILRELMAGPVYTAFASDLLLYGIKGYLSDNAFTRNFPGAGSMVKFGKAMVNRATPKLEASVEDGLKKYLSKSIETTSRRSVEFLLNHLDDDALRNMAQDVWSRLKHRRASEFREHFSELDLEELFVNGYEYWHELRLTPFYSAMIDAGVDGFFDKYGDTSLRELLDEFGITPALMMAEAMRYAPPAIKALKRKKLLEPMLRRYLEPFYRSEAFAQALAGRSPEL
ncbi:MAG: hypothetical protein VX836_13060 [Pseudomonadota bacterium]|jgi:hypothetical protein|nr:hypothetical protein [Pseudomonadota bacterium]